MRVGILQLPSGISGDMFLGALVDAGAPLNEMERAVQAVGGDALTLRASEVMRAGVRGIHVDVLLRGEPIVESGGPVEDAGTETETAGRKGKASGKEDAPGTPRPTPHAPGGMHSPEHSSHSHPDHRPYREILSMLEKASISPEVRSGALAVFRRLAEAESFLHGTRTEDVHFHEVGSWDAVADVVGVVAGIQALGLQRVFHGPVAVGGGGVHAAHGWLPVPAPATLRLLEGRACVLEEGAGELTTPTGAALVGALAEPAPSRLEMHPESVGYGAGRRDPGRRPNLARLTVAREESAAAATGEIAVVEAALDDCTPEEGGHLIARFLETGALDATLTPLVMKKSRPGFLLRLLVPAAQGADFAARITRESSSLGARWRVEKRVTLGRRVDGVRLPEGEVRVKVALLPDGTERPHPEYEDLAAISRARGVPLGDLRREVERRWHANR